MVSKFHGAGMFCPSYDKTGRGIREETSVLDVVFPSDGLVLTQKHNLRNTSHYECSLSPFKNELLRGCIPHRRLYSHSNVSTTTYRQLFYFLTNGISNHLCIQNPSCSDSASTNLPVMFLSLGFIYITGILD